MPTTVRSRALRAWEAANETMRREATETGAEIDEAKFLRPLTPHEARHCAVSYFIACGMNPKQISVYVGHGDVRQTWNRYGHLMPGDEEQAAAQLDAFLGDSAPKDRRAI